MVSGSKGPVGLQVGVEDNGETLRLATPTEFRFAESLAYLARSPLECLYQVEGERVQRALDIDGNRVLIEVSSPTGNYVEISCLNDMPSADIRLTIGDYVRDWFDLDTDIKPFYDMARRDVLLKDLVNRYDGLRVIGVPDLYEALCWAIIGQQINLPFAYQLKQRFVSSFGEFVEWEGTKHWLFPSYEAVAKLTVHDFMGLQFSAKKAEYIITVSQEMASGRLSKDGLRGLGDYGAMEEAMVRIRGIGSWTANYVLMRCLRNPAAFPITDVGLHNAIKQQLNMDNKPSLEEIRELATGWKNWEAYATFYLWRSLQA
jgi:DNA-3-methyladenine glycosylase II